MPDTHPVPQAATGTGPERIWFCLHVCDRVLRSNPLCAAEYAERALHLAMAARNTAQIAHSLFRIGLCTMHSARYSDALYTLSRATSLFEEQRDDLMLARVRYGMGLVYTAIDEYQSALACYTESLAVFRQCRTVVWCAQALNGMGSVHNALSEYPAAAAVLVDAMQTTEQYHNSTILGTSYTSLAAIHDAIGDREMSAQYARQALECMQRDRNRCGEIAPLLQLGMLAVQDNRFDDALPLMTAASDLCDDTDSRAQKAGVLGALGVVHEHAGRLQEALHTYEQGRALAEDTGSKKMAGYCCGRIGRVYRQWHRYDEARAFLHRAADVLTRSGNRLLLSEVYLALSEVYEEVGETDRVLHYYKEYDTLREEILNHRKQRTVAALLARRDIERAEQEREMYRLKMESAALEVRHRERALAATISAVTQKSELLATLSARLRAILTMQGDKAVALRLLLRDVRRQMNLKQDWQAFELLFEEVHRDFMHRLSQRVPTLSRTELRICALLKTHLSSKEIARLLSLSERTIASHRYSIRKKLGIAADAGLATALTSL